MRLRKRVVGMKVSETFKSRAKDVTMLLSSVHHDAMDALYLSELDFFTLNSVVDLLTKHESVFCSQFISENTNRLRLLSIRILDGLLETGLIREVSGNAGTFIWNLEDIPEDKRE